MSVCFIIQAFRLYLVLKQKCYVYWEKHGKRKRWWTPSKTIRADVHIHTSSVTWGQQVQKYHSDFLDLQLPLLSGTKNFNISRKTLGCSVWRTINDTVSKMQSSSISDKRGTSTKSLGEATRGLSIWDRASFQSELKQKRNSVEGSLVQHALCRNASVKCFNTMMDNRIPPHAVQILSLPKLFMTENLIEFT